MEITEAVVCLLSGRLGMGWRGKANGQTWAQYSVCPFQYIKHSVITCYASLYIRYFKRYMIFNSFLGKNEKFFIIYDIKHGREIAEKKVDPCVISVPWRTTSLGLSWLLDFKDDNDISIYIKRNLSFYLKNDYFP